MKLTMLFSRVYEQRKWFGIAVVFLAFLGALLGLQPLLGASVAAIVGILLEVNFSIAKELTARKEEIGTLREIAARNEAALASATAELQAHSREFARVREVTDRSRLLDGEQLPNIDAVKNKLRPLILEHDYCRVRVIAATGSALIQPLLSLEDLLRRTHLELQLVSPDLVRDRRNLLPAHWTGELEAAKESLTTLAARARYPFTVWYYRHLPCVHGVMVDTRHLFISYFAWESDRNGTWSMVGATRPYHYYTLSEATRRHFELFDGWFEGPARDQLVLPARQAGRVQAPEMG